MAVIEKNSKRDEMKKVYCGECAWFKKHSKGTMVYDGKPVRLSPWWYCANKKAYKAGFSTPLEFVTRTITDYEYINADNDCKYFVHDW